MLVGNGNVNGLQACCALQTNDVVGANFKLAVHPRQIHDSSFIYPTRIATLEISQDNSNIWLELVSISVL